MCSSFHRETKSASSTLFRNGIKKRHAHVLRKPTVCSRMLNYNFVAKFTCPHGICLYDWKVVSKADASVLGLIRGREGKRLVWMTCSAGLSWISHIKSTLSGRASLLVPLESGQPISLTKRFIHEPWYVKYLLP
ncbi:hypothetical protein POTOM_033014 [Populus tomentosa]|uniref:Uncharacterized protein n=1 Tax=Populus tomentosa TaxID=118781 RepID=A0A8X7Z3M2_POPTO|nr:hypothetical protein POTOM_033014 [Populus tomentosa]